MQPFIVHLLWMGFAIPISHGSKEGLSRFLLSASLHNCLYTHIQILTLQLYLSCMSLRAQLLGYPFFNKCARSGCFFKLSFIFQNHLGASWLPSCTKILLTVRSRRAVVLDYNIKNIQNERCLFGRTCNVVSGQQCICACAVPRLCT